MMGGSRESPLRLTSHSKRSIVQTCPTFPKSSILTINLFRQSGQTKNPMTCGPDPLGL
jgi:hypothetical protein